MVGSVLAVYTNLFKIVQQLGLDNDVVVSIITLVFMRHTWLSLAPSSAAQSYMTTHP